MVIEGRGAREAAASRLDALPQHSGKDGDEWTQPWMWTRGGPDRLAARGCGIASPGPAPWRCHGSRHDLRDTYGMGRRGLPQLEQHRRAVQAARRMISAGERPGYRLRVAV